MLWNVLLHSERNVLKLGHHRLVRYPSCPQVIRKAHSSNDGLPVAPQLASVSSPEDANEARSWISRFKSQAIMRGSVEMSFSRSSGPGGQVRDKTCIAPHSKAHRKIFTGHQNVNKVNTKATLRCPIDLPWIPLWARNELRKSVRYMILLWGFIDIHSVSHTTCHHPK
jgi:peptidyl-tRNA hydrolase ICT1